MNPTLAFIGAGRIATALTTRLHSVGYNIIGIDSRRRESATVLARLTNSTVFEKIPAADLIFLTVPDDALAAAAAALAEHAPKAAVVHTSGVHSLDALKLFTAYGSFHPVYPFRAGTRLQGDEDMLIGIEASSEPLREQLFDLAHALGGRPALIKPGEKARYHAAAAIASNYLVTLFDISLQLMTQAGVSKDDARHALVNLMQGNLDNLRELSPNSALTGPIARGDIQTIETHLAALHDTPFAEMYRVLGQHTLNIADALPETTKNLLQTLLNTTPNQVEIEKDF